MHCRHGQYQSLAPPWTDGKPLENALLVKIWRYEPFWYPTICKVSTSYLRHEKFSICQSIQQPNSIRMDEKPVWLGAYRFRFSFLIWSKTSSEVYTRSFCSSKFWWCCLMCYMLRTMAFAGKYPSQWWADCGNLYTSTRNWFTSKSFI